MAGEEPLWLLREWSSSITPLHSPDFAELFESVGGWDCVMLFGALVLLTLSSMVVFMGGISSMRLRARKGHIYFTVLYLVGLFMLLHGSEPVVAIPVMGYASVPLIHTFFVRRKGVASTIIYIAVVALSLTTAILPLL